MRDTKSHDSGRFDRRNRVVPEDEARNDEEEILIDEDVRLQDEVRARHGEPVLPMTPDETPFEPADAASGSYGEEQEASAPLFPDQARQELRSRWEDIQAGFVDEPRRSVEEADRLVAETTRRLAESFAEVRRELEEGWKKGGDVSTEDLRLALRRYRSFFGRLLST